MVVIWVLRQQELIVSYVGVSCKNVCNYSCYINACDISRPLCITN